LSEVSVIDLVVDAGSPACRRGGPEQWVYSAGGNAVFMIHVEAGGLTCLVNGRIVDLGAGYLYVFWAATPHKMLRGREDTRASFVTLPFTFLFDGALPQEFARLLLEGHVIGRRAHGVRDARLFERWERDLLAASPRSRDATLLEIRARLVRFAHGIPCETPCVLPGFASNMVERLATHVAAHYPERLSARDLSAQLELRPAYAMAQFRKSFGMSLGRYVAHHRVAHAKRLLAITDLPVRDIALVSGFVSVRRMSAAFRRVLQCSPAAFRRRYRLAPVTGARP